MKHLIALLVAAIGTSVVMPTTAEASAVSHTAPAGTHHASTDAGVGHNSGWIEYRKVRRLVGHTRHGRPIYKWRVVKIKHYGKSYKHHRRH